MNALGWIIGPQLIGIIFMLVGYISMRFPPKKINYLYGYRSPTAMKNQDYWDEANRYAPRFMIKAGLIVTLVGIALATILQLAKLTTETYMLTMSISVIPAAIGTSVMLMTSTEKHLTRTFEQKS